MQVNDEVVLSTVAAAFSMLLLKVTEYFMKKKVDSEDDKRDDIRDFQDDVREELLALRVEARALKEDSDKYRALYHNLLAAEYERSKPRTELTRSTD
jgi:hypothetical protein